MECIGPERLHPEGELAVDRYGFVGVRTSWKERMREIMCWQRKNGLE